jgi:hypothetical protein
VGAEGGLAIVVLQPVLEGCRRIPLQGYLAHKKPPHPRALQQAYSRLEPHGDSKGGAFYYERGTLITPHPSPLKYQNTKRGTASERKGHNLKGFQDFHLKVKATIRLWLSYMCQTHSIADLDPRRAHI